MGGRSRPTRGPRPGLALGVVAVLLHATAPAVAQELSRELRAGEDPRASLSFPARANVCGAGDAILVRGTDGSSIYHTGGRSSWYGAAGWDAGDSPCETGDVRVELGLRLDRVARVDLRVGTYEAGPGRDLGRVRGQSAVDFLLAEARHAEPDAARRLILAASLAADAVVWPALLEMARDRALPAEIRKTAVHWLGREAAAEAVRELGGIVRDRRESDEIRETAVFALSQLPDDQAVSRLIEVVRDVDDARVRSRALFWLAEKQDPRALALFEEILTGG